MNPNFHEFSVQGSEPIPYVVRFSKEGENLKASCTCRAGVMGQICKHRLSILNGEKSEIISDNADNVAEVVSWLAGSAVALAMANVASLEAEKKLIEEKIKIAKKLIAKALNH